MAPARRTVSGVMLVGITLIYTYVALAYTYNFIKVSDRLYSQTTPSKSAYRDHFHNNRAKDDTNNTEIRHPDLRTYKLFSTSAAPSHAAVLPESTTSRTDLYAHRRDVVKRGCQNLNRTAGQSNGLVARPYVVDQRHKIRYCPIEKVGSTFWYRVLTVMGSKQNLDVFNLTLADTRVGIITNPDANRRYLDALEKDGTSFMFIREPYARLFSAYVDKIYHSNLAFWSIIGRDIVNIVRNKDDPRNRAGYGVDVTFPEFVKYVLHLFENGGTMNPHFSPMSESCDPCQHEFQYIGKLETFEDDVNFLLHKWRTKYPDVNVTFTDFNTEAAYDTARAHITFLFEMKKILHIIKLPFGKLMLRTWRNLQIRGYISKTIELPASVSEGISSAAFTELVREAIDATVDNNTVAKQQRDEALIQAYRSVPMEDMERLSIFVSTDCTLFGYDVRPSKLFDRSTPVEYNFNYLDGL